MFDVLKPYVGRHDLPNDSYLVSQEDISSAEHQVGFALARQLQILYRNVGCGFYKVETEDEERDPSVIHSRSATRPDSEQLAQDLQV
jgi:hypothetical protein